VAQHFAAVGAHVDEVTIGETLDLRDEAIVAQAFVDPGLGVRDEIGKDHGKSSFCCRPPDGWLILPEPIGYWRNAAAAQYAMLQRSIAYLALLVNELCANYRQ